MLNYLNTTSIFGKQTSDNFINRKVQCRPTHSFIFSFSCPLFLWEESQGSSPRGVRNTSRSAAISDNSARSTPRRNQARSKMKSRHLALGQTLGRFPVGGDSSLKDLFRRSFMRHVGHMVESSLLGSLD